MNARTLIPAVITTTHIMNLIADVDRTARDHEASLFAEGGSDANTLRLEGLATKAVERVEASLETYATQRAHEVESARQAGAAAAITREARKIAESSGEQAESLDSLDRIIMADLNDDERVTIVTELKHEVSLGRGGRAFHEDAVPALVKAGMVLKGDGYIELTARGLRIARIIAV